MFNNIARLICSVFYLGCGPLAPGTIASFIAVPIYLWAYTRVDIYIFIFLAVTALGFIFSGRVEKALGQKDPSIIVIDEVSGAMIAFFMLPPVFPVLITAFFLFRAFDMFKIYPANRLEKIHGSVGVMMDDIVAGLYTNLIMHLALSLKILFI